MLLIFILIIATVLFFVWQFWQNKKEIFYNTGKVCLYTQSVVGNNCFDVEIAENNFQRERGLMDRKILDQNKGMFFVFDKEDNYSFWMKNTLIPLDIIWINQDKKIVYISENTQPCLTSWVGKTFFCPQINPQQNAKYVLEINAGLANKLNIKLGDYVFLE